MAHHHVHDIAERDQRVRRALTGALVLNASFLVVEAVAGWMSGSLALISDAAHMVGDVAALVLALAASHVAGWATGPEGTYGLRRVEVLGAFLSAAALLVGCGVLAAEAVRRLFVGAGEVLAGPVLLVGVLGLAINVGSAWWLHRVGSDNLNVRGALLHMLADALGSVGAIAAAGLVMLGLPWGDPLVGLLIVALVVRGTVGLLKDAARVLLQFAPAGLEVAEVRALLAGVPGVTDVHDLHLWSLDGQGTIVTAHLVVGEGDVEAVRRAARQAVLGRIPSAHLTLEMEVVPGCGYPDCPLTAPASGG